MALELMTDEELKLIGINGQKDSELDLINGIFYKQGWVLEKEDIATDGSVFINKYNNEKLNVSVFLKQVRISSTLLTGNSYDNFKFYKEV